MSKAEGKQTASDGGGRLRAWRLGIGLTAGVGLAVYLLSGIYVVNPEEQAVSVLCGKAMPGIILPGTHYRLPYPFGQVFVLKPNEVKSIAIPGSVAQVGPGAEFITGDENIIHIALNVQYRVGNPKAYSFRSTQPGKLVEVAAEVALMDTVARTHVDDILTSGKHVLLARVKELCQQDLQSWNTGIEVISVNFASVSPPAAVNDAFKDVASALEDKDRIVNEALGDQNEALHQAKGEAHKTKSEAEGLAKGRVNRAKGEVARFNRILQEYRQAGNDELTRSRLYIESMEKILPEARKYLVDSPGSVGAKPSKERPSPSPAAEVEGAGPQRSLEE